MKKPKQITETKCTCKACGNVWYFDKRDESEMKGKKMMNMGNSMSNAGTDMMCCGGCLPALFMPKKANEEVKDLNVCQKCGSKAITKEKITHDVE